MRTHRTFSSCLILTALLTGVGPVFADAPLVLDDFDAPTTPRSAVAVGKPGSPSSTVDLVDSVSLVPGGVRESTLNMYGGTVDSISALSVGDGRLSVAQGTGAQAETLISYGGFTRPTGDPTVGGPLLGLDLSTYTGLSLEFSGVEDSLNVNVVYYTSAPLSSSSPVYYASSGVNVAPTLAGGPLSFVLEFSADEAFNWKHVDGIVVIINRSGPIPSTSYAVDKLTFVR